jgi:cytochrome c biogenesis protein CcdA
MIELLVVVGTIGLLDGINPTTLGPALYLASGPSPRRSLAAFTAAVFGVSLVGGLAIALGPGQLLLSAVPHPTHRVRHVIEIVLGAALLLGAALTWRLRHRLDRVSGKLPSDASSAAALGAGIMAVELPTAVPYFGAIAAIVGSDRSIGTQILLIVYYNVLFVLPLLAILAALTYAGPRALKRLRRAGDWLRRRTAALLAILLAAAGCVLVGLGVTGLLNSSA